MEHPQTNERALPLCPHLAAAVLCARLPKRRPSASIWPLGGLAKSAAAKLLS